MAIRAPDGAKKGVSQNLQFDRGSYENVGISANMSYLLNNDRESWSVNNI